MLKFALEYHLAIDKMAKEKQLQAYELDGQEWKIISELCEVLKVRPFVILNVGCLFGLRRGRLWALVWALTWAHMGACLGADVGAHGRLFGHRCGRLFGRI